MSAKELIKNFKQWNPMENDYRNTEFNNYASGPGAALDAEIQPGQQALQNRSGKQGDQKDNQPVPTLVFRNLPQNMTMKAMHNMCSRHGRVISIRDSNKNDYYFVELATVADMEAVFRGLENNNYGFKIMVGKRSSERRTPQTNQYVGPVPPKTTGIDYQNRTYRTSTKQHPRPRVQQEPALNKISALENTGLPLKLLADDAHSLERQGLYKTPNNKNFNYRNGRAYVSLPEKTKQFMDKKHMESSGTYNSSSNKYIHEPENDMMPSNIRACFVCFYTCDTVCARCSEYYCSIECQHKDWPQHRYTCGKPKHLQKTPPPEKQNEPEHNKSPESAKQNKKNTANAKFIKSNEDKKPTRNNSANISVNTSANTPKQDASPSASSTSTNSKQNSPANDKQVAKENIPPSGNIVVVTAISKTNLVFIRSKSYDANLSYFNTTDGLQAVGHMLKTLKAVPKSGQMVIAKFQNQFNRALILQFKALEEIIVHLMDYGNIEYLSLKDLYEAPNEFFNIPRHAIPVLLKDVPDFYMTEEIRKFMYTYLNNNINVEIRYKPEDFRKENNIYAVELIDENTQQNFNKIILKLSKPVQPTSSDELCKRGYLEHKLLPSGDDVELFVMDNSVMCSGCISCTIKPYVNEIEKFQKELQSFAESLPNESYTPSIDELCIARYSVDGLWYRGICLEAVGDGHPSVHFIDYGNINIIPIEDIRRYPRQFTFPIYTADCAIKGLPEDCDEKIVDKLEMLIPNGRTIKCHSVTVVEEDNFYIISLPNVLRGLIDCGLLEYGTQSFEN